LSNLEAASSSPSRIVKRAGKNRFGKREKKRAAEKPIQKARWFSRRKNRKDSPVRRTRAAVRGGEIQGEMGLNRHRISSTEGRPEPTLPKKTPGKGSSASPK